MIYFFGVRIIADVDVGLDVDDDDGLELDDDGLELDDDGLELDDDELDDELELVVISDVSDITDISGVSGVAVDEIADFVNIGVSVVGASVVGVAVDEIVDFVNDASVVGVAVDEIADLALVITSVFFGAIGGKVNGVNGIVGSIDSIAFLVEYGPNV